MVVDKRGNAYVGGRNGGPYGQPNGNIILVRPDGSFELAADGMVTPNGPAVTPDGQHLIVAETALGRLTRFRIGEDGRLSEREIMAERPGHVIDGMCLDAEGAVWCGGGLVGAYRLSATGEVLDEVPNPGRSTLAVALGGPKGTTLFLASTDMTLHDNIMHVGADRTLDATVSSGGRIETIEVSVPGVEAP
jgi:sugar lactone lactonase YvrE